MPTMAARVRSKVKPCGIYDGKVALDWFSPRTSGSHASSHFTSCSRFIKYCVIKLCSLDTISLKKQVQKSILMLHRYEMYLSHPVMTDWKLKHNSSIRLDLYY
jgi:hypothetical protein